jgi:hypothetical protein
MGFSSGGISPNNVDLDSSQTVSNKTLDASNDYSGDIINPSRSDVKQDTQANLETYASGAANGQMCFATDTKQMYQVLDGALAPVGGGSGGLDTFFTDTFEIAGVDDYTSGNDAAFDNGGVLAGSLAVEAVNNISGDQSLKYTQAAGSLNDFIKSPLIPIDKKQQGNTVGLELYYTYSGNDGDLRIVGYDDTGSEVMTIASNTLRAASKAQRFSVQFPVPSGSANLAWGIQVGVENDGAILVIDDVQMSTNPFVSKDIQGENTFSARIENSGTATIASQGGLNEDNINAIASVNRSSLGVVTVTFTTGFFSVIPSISGIVQRGTDNRIMSIDAISTSSVTISTNISTSGASVDVNFTLNISRQGSDYRQPTEHIVAYNSRNAENSMIRYSLNNYTKSGSTINWGTPVESSGNAITTSNNQDFNINEDGLYYISALVTGNVQGNSMYLTKNLTSTANGNSNTLDWGFLPIAGYDKLLSWTGSLIKGDVIRVLTNSSSTVNYSKLTISKIGVGDLLGTPIPRTAYIKDVKPSGTSGGTFTAGAWQTRDLNTLSGDTEFVSLSSNQFTLQPGKYEIEASAPAYVVQGHKLRLRNITDSSDDLLGDNLYSNATSIVQNALMIGTLEVTSVKTFEIQHRGTATQVGNGFGGSVSFGVDEIYTQIKITKVS